MSSFISSINILPSSYESYDSEELCGYTGSALKVLATITLVIPLTIGCYEYFRPRDTYIINTDDFAPRNFTTKVAITVATLGLNILYIGVTELWARYPTRFVEHSPLNMRFDLAYLSPDQLDHYLNRPGVIENLSNSQIKYVFDELSHYSVFVINSLKDNHLKYFLYDVIDNSKEDLLKFSNEVFIAIGVRLKYDHDIELFRKIGLQLPLDRLVKVSRWVQVLPVQPYLSSLTSRDISLKLNFAGRDGISQLGGASLSNICCQISSKKKQELINYYFQNSEAAKSLEIDDIVYLLSTDESIKLKRALLSRLTHQTLKTLRIKHENVIFKTKSNDELFAMLPDDHGLKDAFIHRFSPAQFREMDLELLKGLYFQIVGRDSLINLVSNSLINEFINTLGLEIALIKALSPDKLRSLNLSKTSFIRRKVVVNRIDWRTETVSTSFVLCEPLEGLLRLICNGLHDISDLNFSSSKNFFLIGKYTKFLSSNNFCNTLLIFSDEQIQQLIWNMVPVNIRLDFIKILIDRVQVLEPSRYEALKILLNQLPRISIEPSQEELTNAYGILGVQKGCSKSVARKAFLKLSLITHPDRGGDSEKFVKLNCAWELVQEDLK